MKPAELMNTAITAISDGEYCVLSCTLRGNQLLVVCCTEARTPLPPATEHRLTTGLSRLVAPDLEVRVQSVG